MSMSKKLHRRSIIKHTIQLGISTVISKGLGFVRELLLARYLGVGPLADAFFTAFRIPNSLRKIFAEGALSAAFVPTLTHVVTKEGHEQASYVTTGALLVMQGILLPLCALLAFYAPFFVALQVPGWITESSHEFSERFTTAVTLFKILIFYITCISMSSLFAGALQGINKFSIAAWGQISMNVFWIIQLWICSRYDISLSSFSWLVLANGACYALVHYVFYRAAGFRLALVFTRDVWCHVWQGIKKFVPCALGNGAVEINLYIDQIVASYLPEGSLSLLNYTQGFVRLPLGTFAVAFGTIVLSHFSRISTYAPRRLGYYVLESAKFVFWVTLPVTILMSVFSYKIFYTTYYSFSDKFALEYVHDAAVLLVISLSGLFFFSFNKIILNVYYALHETRWPTIITIISTVCNTILNIIGMQWFGINGIVLATTIAACIQMIMLLIVLKYIMNIRLYGGAFWNFAARYVLQLTCTSILLYGLYNLLVYTILCCSLHMQHILLETIVYWLWVGPLCLLYMLLLYSTRKEWGIRVHFLD